MNHGGKNDRNQEYQDSNDSASTPVLQRTAMEMDRNLTKLGQPFQVLMTNQQKLPKRSYDVVLPEEFRLISSWQPCRSILCMSIATNKWLKQRIDLKQKYARVIALLILRVFCPVTVEALSNEPPYNQVLDITNDVPLHSNRQYMEKDLDLTKPRYSEHIQLPVPGPSGLVLASALIAITLSFKILCRRDCLKRWLWNHFYCFLWFITKLSI